MVANNILFNQVIEGDCLDVLRTLPDNSIDLICTEALGAKVKRIEASQQLSLWG